MQRWISENYLGYKLPGANGNEVRLDQWVLGYSGNTNQASLPPYFISLKVHGYSILFADMASPGIWDHAAKKRGGSQFELNALILMLHRKIIWKKELKTDRLCR